ncbi:hypothetical protein [Bacillus andreraoultii]|uniref:hypothetical protein n=1 Tax=Bacillus andreraoultii TaxID=1499685 RepID=UPI00053A2520|nr:hypothetical protein [Bacillus andreraoultii]
MYEEITAVYSRHNKELMLSIYDEKDHLLIRSKMPKLIAYKIGDIVDGPNNQKYIVTGTEDNIFNPKKLHKAKLKRKTEE